MPEKKRPSILLTPGPVPLRVKTRKILSEPAIHHRSAEFQSIFRSVREKLKYVFQTQEEVLVLNSSGTGAMEAGLVNILSPGDSVICVCGGKFGERWRDMALSYGIKVQALNVPWGQAVSLKEAEESLEKHPTAKAFLVSACETSTGTEHPIEGLGDLLKKHSALFMVDGMTGLGSMKLNMDEMGIDALVGGSQKSFMLTAGLSFIALSQKARERKSSCPRYYFDLRRESLAQKRDQTAFSPSVPLIKSLNDSLNFLMEEGLDSVILRSRTMAKATRSFCRVMELSLFSKTPAGAVTAVQMPRGISGEQIKKSLEEKFGVIVAGGQGALKDKIIRFGHLGPVSKEDLLFGLKAFGCELADIRPKSRFPARKAPALKAVEEDLKALPPLRE